MTRMKPAATPTRKTPVKGNKSAFAHRLKEARIGDLQAQYEVGLAYASGNGTEVDVGEAQHWFQSAARRGHVGAQYLLGVGYASGVGVPRDDWEALRWFFRAQEQGNANATYQLSRLFDKQHLALRDRSWAEAAAAGVAKAQWQLGRQSLVQGGPLGTLQALEWLGRAAEQGLAEAQYALGVLLSAPGEHHDMDAALERLQQAADQGMASAYLELEALNNPGQLDATPRGTRRKSPKGLEERLSSFAQSGSAENQYHLGVLYERGLVVACRQDRALDWYRSAAQRGDALAQTALARLLADTDPQSATQWYAQAAALGNAEAQHAYAVRLSGGIGVAPDPLAAHLWFSRAAAQDQPDALDAIAVALQASQPELALACTLKAAQAGHAGAQHRLALACHRGDGVAQDQAEAVRWMTRAAEGGHAPAQCDLAGWYAQGTGVPRDLARAATWYAQAVDAGPSPARTRAQWGLGSLLAQGGPGLAPDVKRATLLCRKAANAGYAPAQATMGLLMARAGQHDKALRWWDKAAEQGDPEAQYNLGMARLQGRGAVEDAEVAFTWVMYAAQAGVAVAQQRIGFAYATGLGVPVDVVEATKWFLLAEAAGSADARANLEHARTLLSPPQWAEARRRADVWVPKVRTGA